MSWTRLALIITLALWAGCTRGSVLDGEPPQTVVDVETIVFAKVALGQSDTETVTITNVGRGDLRLDSITLVESTDDDEGGAEFRPAEDWIEQAVIGTDGELTLAVTYTPADRDPDEGFIVIESNDPRFDDGTLRIPIQTAPLEPRVHSKSSVIFRRVAPVDVESLDTHWQILEIQNVGDAPLKISDVVVSPADGDFSARFADFPNADPRYDEDLPPDSLEPGEALSVRIYFNPQHDMGSSGELILYSNDPQSPEHVVPLLGNSGAPCMKLDREDELDFGNGAIGYVNHKTIIVENCSSTADLVLSDVEICTFDDDACSGASGVFALDEGTLPGDLPDGEALIAPEETAMFVITYAPEELVASEGELTLKSNDPAKSELAIPVRGVGTDNACPTAIADARLEDSDRWQSSLNTVPLKTVRLRGSNSTDPDGQVDSYEWVMIERPTNSHASVSPSAFNADASLFLDLAGDYRLELVVYDDDGTRSCGDQAIINIRATPDEDIHVQLVWETPNDIDETDTSGSDVDLHFLHPMGTWNSAPFDIFWTNPTADWGAPGEYDDPTLDIDDTDGGGPENVNLSEPESGATYSVGIYYYDDSGYGGAYATVRIFIRGEKKFEKREMFLRRPGEFWHVANVAWPSTEVFPIESLQSGFPQ